MDIITKKYEQFVEKDTEANPRLLENFGKILNKLKNKKILDVGCGRGALLIPLLNKNDVYGLDRSEKAVKIAKKRGIKIRKQDVTKKFPFKDNKFDYVICKDIMEHLEDPQSVLTEIKRVLKPNGSLLISVPNQFNIFARFEILFGGNMIVKRWFPGANEWDLPHLRFFTRRGMKKFMKQNSFEIIKDYSYLTGYNIPPQIGIQMVTLARLLPNLFSAGITFECKNKK